MKAYYPIIGILFFIGLFSNTANAQIIDTETPSAGFMKYSNGQLYLDGTKLSDNYVKDIIGADLWHKTYSGARKQYKAGSILMLSGAAVMVTGSILMLASPYNEELWDYPGSYYAGSVALVVGVAVFEAGLPFYFIGRGRLKWIAEDYNNNRASKTSLNVTAGKYGVGLALKF